MDITKMRYSIKPRDGKGYGFLSFARNIGKNISNRYGQKLVDSAIKSGATKVATNAIKTASKRAIQKAAEATRDLIGNKFADNITSKNLKNYLQKNCLKMKLIMKHHSTELMPGPKIYDISDF